MVLPDSHRVARAPWYSGTAPKIQPFRLQGCHLLWPDFPDSSARVGFCNFVGLCRVPRTVLQPRTYNAGRLAYARFGHVPRSLAATRRISFDFCSWGYLDVSIPPVRVPRPMYSAGEQQDMTPAGFPHSEISGSTPACDSPELFAANHVLHRLLTPRHSPCALSSLATNLHWNPKRVPDLRRSLRQAKLAFARSAAPSRDRSPARLKIDAHHLLSSIAIRRLQGRDQSSRNEFLLLKSHSPLTLDCFN